MSSLKKIKHHTNKCPYCKTKFNSSAALNTARAIRQPGDVSICGNCGNISAIAADGLTLRKALDADTQRWQQDPVSWEIIEHTVRIVKSGNLEAALKKPPIRID